MDALRSKLFGPGEEGLDLDLDLEPSPLMLSSEEEENRADADVDPVQAPPRNSVAKFCVQMDRMERSRDSAEVTMETVE